MRDEPPLFGKVQMTDHLNKDHSSEVMRSKPACSKWRKEWEGRNEIQ